MPGGNFQLREWHMGIPSVRGGERPVGGIATPWSRNGDAVEAGGAEDLPTAEAGTALHVLPAVDAGEFEVGVHIWPFEFWIGEPFI